MVMHNLLRILQLSFWLNRNHILRHHTLNRNIQHRNLLTLNVPNRLPSSRLKNLLNNIRNAQNSSKFPLFQNWKMRNTMLPEKSKRSTNRTTTIDNTRRLRHNLFNLSVTPPLSY